MEIVRHIPESLQDYRVFEFSQLGTSPARERDGSGIGRIVGHCLSAFGSRPLRGDTQPLHRAPSRRQLARMAMPRNKSSPASDTGCLTAQVKNKTGTGVKGILVSWRRPTRTR